MTYICLSSFFSYYRLVVYRSYWDRYPSGVRRSLYVCMYVCMYVRMSVHSNILRTAILTTFIFGVYMPHGIMPGLFFSKKWYCQKYANELKILRKRSKIFFFKTAGQTALIFGIQVPRDDLIQVCSNCDEIYHFVFLRIFLPFLVKNSSSSKPLVRQLWYLVYRSLGMT